MGADGEPRGLTQQIREYEKLREKEDIKSKDSVLAKQQVGKNYVAADLKTIDAEAGLAGAGDGDASAAHLPEHRSRHSTTWSCLPLQ